MSGGRHLMSCIYCDEFYYCLCPVDDESKVCDSCVSHQKCEVVE